MCDENERKQMYNIVQNIHDDSVSRYANFCPQLTPTQRGVVTHTIKNQLISASIIDYSPSNIYFSNCSDVVYYKAKAELYRFRYAHGDYMINFTEPIPTYTFAPDKN